MNHYDPHALIGFLEEREAWTFGYGPQAMTHDCARFSGAALFAVFGDNPLNRFSGQWRTHRGARRILVAHGGMAAAVSEVMTSIDLTHARRGELGMTEGGQLVVFEGETVVGPASVRGLYRLPRAAAVRAWTI